MKKTIPILGLTLASFLPIKTTTAQTQNLTPETQIAINFLKNLEYQVGISRVNLKDDDLGYIFDNQYGINLGIQKPIKKNFYLGINANINWAKDTENGYKDKLNSNEFCIDLGYKLPLNEKASISAEVGLKTNKTKYKSEDTIYDEIYKKAYSGTGYEINLIYGRMISDNIKIFGKLNTSNINSDNEDEIDLSSTNITAGIKFSLK
jgi:hypothetical protein